MPESRDRLVRVAAAAGEPALGVGIRRGVYQDMLWDAAFGPASRSGFQNRAARSRGPWVAAGDENARPGGALRRRGSPLPAWYPRTPLRDITALANAMERRRSAQRLAARQRRNRSIELSSPSAAAITPLPQGSSLSETTTPVVCDIPDTSPLVTATGLSATESPPRTPCDAIIAAAGSSKLAELETRLEKSIDVIEKAVKENLKRTLKVNDEKARQGRTLMSMR